MFLIYKEEQKELQISGVKDDSKIKVLQVINAEQMITSPNLGLKGKTDLVLFCELTTKKNGTEEIRRCFMPFELKTGEREVTLYNMQVNFSLNKTDKNF